MYIESLKLTNFRSYGPQSETVSLSGSLTTLIGANGTGKTVVMQALQRLFGVSNNQRAICRQDFHVPAEEVVRLTKRSLSIEALIAFPELELEGADHSAIPDFFRYMSVTDHNGKLKCRLRLDADWEDDGSVDGDIVSRLRAITTFGEYNEADCHNVRPADRSRIQLIYVPATRSASSQVSSFLKGRLWKAINWSSQVRASFDQNARQFNSTFEVESAIQAITGKLTERWQQLHSAGTNSTPKFRPIDTRFEEFVKSVDVLMHPDENGQDRSIEELSDGQSSLFHIAMTSAALDMEADILNQPQRPDFLVADLPLPSLTILALEEPENSLAPFYLSRIIDQITQLSEGIRAQAILSSHSPSILSRVEPAQVRHFRLCRTGTTVVKKLKLPTELTDDYKYIQQAVRAYPELYFAKCVVLGEGASEEIILPIISKSMGTPIDRSFVAMVPLGGRHVNHMWRLLSDLEIPYVTLLDLDWGRYGGGWGRIKNAVSKLIEFGVDPSDLFGTSLSPGGYEINLDAFDRCPRNDSQNIQGWINLLRRFGVYFSAPLDIDYSLLSAFPNEYQVNPDESSTGPSPFGDPTVVVLGENGNPGSYRQELDRLRWYRYLFLGRGKPSTHMRVLSRIPPDQIASRAPEELKTLVRAVQTRLNGNQQA